MKIEIRSSNEAIISGYVNVTERYSRPLRYGGKRFIEKIKAGTFKKAIEDAESENRAINMLVDHYKNKVFANTRDGTLYLKEDNVGLFARATIDDAEIIERARKGGAKGWSFGFCNPKDEFITEGDIEKRSIEKLTLGEVSLIFDKIPCYVGTSVEVRADGDVEYEERGYEDNVEIIELRAENKDPEIDGKDFIDTYKKRVELLKLRRDV